MPKRWTAADYDTYDIIHGFGQVAPGYDRSNDAMTLGMHRRWRRSLCRLAAERFPRNGRWLDIATGTADVLVGVLGERPDLRAVGVDPAAPMLRLAREKLDREVAGVAVPLAQGDCRRLPFPSDSFDAVTISWGIRNVRPFREGLDEIQRVLKPGGVLLVLESGPPESAFVRTFYSFYKRALPWIGEKFGGYRPTFEYYWRSVDRFPSGPKFVEELHEAGYGAAEYKALFGGICYLYSGLKLL
ncbi:MAG: ubiquinone/menaquinone biosynthesis methyltransferase [Acidobacteria bacterium]|nr:ubiquinone/menaquinone biosynthesis methyltransferase [Acidobacteriota bacterium]